MSSVSRRTVLVAPVALALGASVAGCTAPPAPIAHDPDRDALDAALLLEQSLSSHAGTWTGGPVSRESVIHVLDAHVTRLTQTLGPSASPTTPSPTTPPPTPSTSTQALRTAAARAATAHTKASQSAGPQTAQLLASLAASDAAIAAALGGSA